MIRATAGTWLNYSTTLAFQVLFAARFGNTAVASAFVLTFSVVLTLNGIVTSSLQSVVVPRLVDDAGRMRSRALRLVGSFVGVASAVLLAVGLAAVPIAHGLAVHLHVVEGPLTYALRLGCVFGFLQIVAGGAIVVGLVHGHRFVPAVAPALPSLVAALLLAVRAHPSLSDVYGSLTIGSAVELLLLARGLLGARLGGEGAMPRSALSLATALQFGLLALVIPLERAVASVGDPGGAAAYNYAIRSLAVVMQLVVGGVALSTLADWSAVRSRGDFGEIRRSLGPVVVSCAVALGATAAVAVASAPQIVAVVYQHGSFSSHDSRIVAGILVLALPGFWAEGVGLVLSQAFLAACRNRVAITIGVGYGVVRIGLGVGFGIIGGARGVALAYSVSTVVALAVQVIAAIRLGLVGPEIRRRATAAAAVVGSMLAAAGILAAVRSQLPAPAVLALAVVSCGGLALGFRFRSPPAIAGA